MLWVALLNAMLPMKQSGETISEFISQHIDHGMKDISTIFVTLLFTYF